MTERVVYEFTDVGGERIVRLFDAQAGSIDRANAAYTRYSGNLSRGQAGGQANFARNTLTNNEAMIAQAALLERLDGRLTRLDRRLAVIGGRMGNYTRGLRNAGTATRGLRNDAAGLRQEYLLLDAAESGFRGRINARTGLLSNSAAAVGVGALGVTLAVTGEQQYIRAERAAGLYNDTQQEVNETVQRFRVLSLQSFQPLEGVTQRYQKLGLVQEQLGATTPQALAILQGVANAERLQGGATRSTQAGTDQLVQGLTSGFFGGDELRSVRENLPVLADAISDALSQIRGVEIDVGDLRNQGGISSRELAQALLIAERDLSGRARDLDPTLAEAGRKTLTSFQILNQEIGKIVGASDGLVFILGRFSESALIASAALESVANNEFVPLSVQAGAATFISLFNSDNDQFSVPELYQQALDNLTANQEADGGRISFEERLIRLREESAGFNLGLTPTDLAPPDRGRQLQEIRESVNTGGRNDSLGNRITSDFGRLQSLRFPGERDLEQIDRDNRESDAFREERRFNNQLREDLLRRGFEEENINEVLDQRKQLFQTFIDQQRELEDLSKQAFFSENLDRSNDDLRRRIDFERELSGASEPERAGAEAVFALERDARLENIELTQIQKQETRELAELYAQDQQSRQDALSFAEAGTSFFRDLTTDIDSAGEAAGRLAQRFADLLLEIFVFRQITQFLTGAFSPATTPAAAAQGGVFPQAMAQGGFAPSGVQMMNNGGFTTQPTYFPSLNVITSEYNQEEAVVPLTKDDFGRLPNGKLGGKVRSQPAAATPAAVLTARDMRRGVTADEVVRAMEQQISKPGSKLNRAVRGASGR